MIGYFGIRISVKLWYGRFYVGIRFIFVGYTVETGAVFKGKYEHLLILLLLLILRIICLICSARAAKTGMNGGGGGRHKSRN